MAYNVRCALMSIDTVMFNQIVESEYPVNFSELRCYYDRAGQQEKQRRVERLILWGLVEIHEHIQPKNQYDYSVKPTEIGLELQKKLKEAYLVIKGQPGKIKETNP